MIKVAVCGACGKMGTEVVKMVLNHPEYQLCAAFDITNTGEDIGTIVYGKPCNIIIQNDIENALSIQKPDVVVDFTTPQVIFEHAKLFLQAKVCMVIGTTGLATDQMTTLKDLSLINHTGCFIAPNFSIGAVLLMRFAQQAAAFFDNVEIIELHHNQKKDAPSGTALKTAQLMANIKKDFSMGSSAETAVLDGARGYTTAENLHIHAVRLPGYMASQEVLCGSEGQILTLRHDSFNRQCYMPGVRLAIDYVMQHKDFTYGLDNIVKG